MKKTMRTLRLVACALCLTTVMYNCKTEEVASITPFTYTFRGLENLKLPDITPTAPAAVSVTAATFTASAQAAAVNSGLADIAATGVVPAAVQQASANVGKAVSANEAAALVAMFTPDVINNLTSTGTLPANLKAQVAAIASNPAVAAYMPTYTLPTVNGKPVGGRLGAATTVAGGQGVQGVADGSTDACKQAATDAYNRAVASLDQARQTQIATVNAAYTAAEAAANAEVPGCQSGVPAKYSALVTSAKQTLDANVANLNAAKAILGEATYNLLSVLNYVAYSQIIGAFTTLQAAETNACSATKDAKIAAAKIARDTDLARIDTNYNAVTTAARTARDQAIASCHNQGNGG